MVSTRPLISKSSSPCTNPLVTVPSAPITIGITVTFMFHRFVNSLARFKYYLSFQFPSVGFHSVVRRDNKFDIVLQGFVLVFCRFSGGCLFVLLNISRSCLLAGIGSSVCILKSQRILCIPFSKTDSGLYINNLLLSLLLLFTPWEFFSSFLAGPPILQDSSRYSGRSQ